MKTPLFKKVDCISLKVPDLDEGLDFYQKKLGHKLNWKAETMAGLSLPDDSSELVLHTDERPMETDFLVESVPEAVEKFKTAGGTVIAGPFEIKIGLCVVVKDPWGNKFIMLDLSKGLLSVDSDKNVIE